MQIIKIERHFNESCFLAAVCTPRQIPLSLSYDFDSIGLEGFYFLFGNNSRKLQLKACDFFRNYFYSM